MLEVPELRELDGLFITPVVIASDLQRLGE